MPFDLTVLLLQAHDLQLVLLDNLLVRLQNLLAQPCFGGLSSDSRPIG